MIRRPQDLSRILIEALQPATHAHFAAGVADEHHAVRDERGHRHRLTEVDVADLRFPDGLSAVGVEGDGAVVERVEEQLPGVEHETAVHDVAARDAL
jgi:hypothetical protein